MEGQRKKHGERGTEREREREGAGMRRGERGRWRE